MVVPRSLFSFGGHVGSAAGRRRVFDERCCEHLGCLNQMAENGVSLSCQAIKWPVTMNSSRAATKTAGDFSNEWEAGQCSIRIVSENAAERRFYDSFQDTEIQIPPGSL